MPSESELRVAQAQLVGWLEGLFHGIQASIFAQQAAAAAQLEKMRDRSLNPARAEPRSGTYLEAVARRPSTGGSSSCSARDSRAFERPRRHG